MSSRVLLGSAVGTAIGVLIARLVMRRTVASAASRSAGTPREEAAGVLRFQSWISWLGGFFGVVVPILCAALAWSSRSPRPIDFYSCIGMAVFFGASGWYLFLESRCSRVEFDDVGVASRSLFQSRREVRWDEITNVRASRSLGYIALDNGHDPPVRVTAALQGFGRFAGALRAHVAEPLLREPLQELARYHARFGVR